MSRDYILDVLYDQKLNGSVVDESESSAPRLVEVDDKASAEFGFVFIVPASDGHFLALN